MKISLKTLLSKEVAQPKPRLRLLHHHPLALALGRLLRLSRLSVHLPHLLHALEADVHLRHPRLRVVVPPRPLPDQCHRYLLQSNRRLQVQHFTL